MAPSGHLPVPDHCDGACSAPMAVKVVVQFIMRIDHATRLAIGSRERGETGLRVVEWTGDQLRLRRPFQRSG